LGQKFVPLMLLFLLGCPSAAKADEVFSTVLSVSDAGEITVESGQTLWLWALETEDSDRFRQFVMGRTIYCDDVSRVAMDCLFFPRDELAMTHPIRALQWFPDLGFAKYVCPSLSETIFDAGRAPVFVTGTYACENNKPQFPFTSLGVINARDFRKLLALRRQIDIPKP
jgi:hypothetical protein